MANTSISLNGSSFSPTTIETAIEKIGITKRAANGTLYFYFRANKRVWNISWSGLPESLLTGIRTIGLLTASFIMIDEFGSSFTVIIPPGGYTQEMSAERRSLAGTFYYDVSLQVQEV
jgi:hypothetical protein